MITILKVRDDGQYANLPRGHRGYTTTLTMIDAKGFLDNSQNKTTSMMAKTKALSEARSHNLNMKMLGYGSSLLIMITIQSEKLVRNMFKKQRKDSIFGEKTTGNNSTKVLLLQ